jgi:hypothetical protein
VARALQSLLTELNNQQPRMLSSGPLLAFHLGNVSNADSLT